MPTMATKLAVAVTFFLFAVSSARSPSDLPESENVPTLLPSGKKSLESQPTTAVEIVPEKEIRYSKLPVDTNNIDVEIVPETKARESQPTTAVEIVQETESRESKSPVDDTNAAVDTVAETETTESKPLDATSEIVSDTETRHSKGLDDTNERPEFYTVAVDTIDQNHRPSDFVSFRPINRHFRSKRQFPPRRPCHHRVRYSNARFHGRNVPYGDNMILSGETSEFDPIVFRSSAGGGVRQVPQEWIRIHHHHHDVPRFPFEHHHMFTKEKFQKHFHHNDNDQEGRESGKERKERQDGGLMKRFRKFLNEF